jgi:hypothetical protein
MSQLLTRTLTTHVVNDSTPAREKKIIGGRLDPIERQAIARTVKDHVSILVNTANKALYNPGGTCAKCHDTLPNPKASANEAAPMAIEPAGIPTVWFEQARFNHVSHRAMQCSECHPGKDKQAEKGNTTVIEHEPIGILGIESCKNCHGPRETVQLKEKKTAVERGGVRYKCTDCHSYHNGAKPLQGLGAPARDPLQKRTTWELLGGAP